MKTRKKAVFVLGTMDYRAVRRGEAFMDSTIDLLDKVSEQAGVDASLVLCMQDPLTAGRSKGKARMKQKDIMAERPRVLTEIGRAKPDFVMCFGPVATACVFGKGNLAEGELLRQAHHPMGEDQPPVYVTFSMENARYKAGLKKWLALDVQAAAHGHRETEWGDYLVLRPDDEEWDIMPDDLGELADEAQLGKEPAIGFDLETYPGLDPWHPDARIRMAVISDQVGRAWIIQATPDSRFPSWVADLVEDPLIIKAGSNIKFDYKWMRRFGYTIENMWDTSVAEHVIDCTNPKKDLKSLTFRYVPKLGDYSRAHRDLVRQRGGWEHVTDAEQYEYCGGDGEASIGAYLGQVETIEQLGRQRPMQLMNDLYPVLARMEANGSCISMEKNRELDQLYQEKLAALRDQITEHLGPINPNSHQQLAKALKAAVPHIRLTARDWQRAVGDEEDEESSTKREILERESDKHPVIPIVLEFRKYRTRHSTFIKGVAEKYAVQHGGHWFVHPTYRADVVETARLSSQGPNDQNCPTKDNDDPDLSIKKQFVSRFKGGEILEIDQGQVEIRMAAMLSGDVNMLAAINSGEDIHTAMASIMLAKPAAEVTELERYLCKRRTFLILFGGGAAKLSRDLKISRRKAQRLIDEYFEAFPQLRGYIDWCHARVREDLQVETIWGFVRQFDRPEHWESPDGWSIQRKAFNTRVQNGAVGVTYCAMIYVDREIQRRKLRSVLIKQIHDSLVVDIAPGERDEIVELVTWAMNNAGVIARDYGVDITVPLACDVAIGASWGDTTKLAQAA